MPIVVPEISTLRDREALKEKQLLPIRHPQGELFLCDLGDVPLKDDAASMAHPVFALSTKPDLKKRVYEHNGNRIEVTPSTDGLATIYDKDILIFAISQIMEAKNRGLPYSRDVSFSALDFLKFANRMTNGQSYEGLRAAMQRLRGTTITTDVITGGVEQSDTFGLIEKSRVRRKMKDGTVTDWSVTLSEWLFNAIEANEVLTLHPDYFRLRRPLERRLYEILRKHCGNQPHWRIGIGTLLKKTGSQATLKKFRQLLKPIMEADHLPDYGLSYEDDKQTMLIVTNRREDTAKQSFGRKIVLQADTYDKARRAAPSWDVYHLEQQWRAWMNSKKGEKAWPSDPDLAFVGFCRRYFERNGRA